MNDTIYREDAIKALKDNVIEMGGDDFCEMGVHTDDIEAVVNAIPSADRPTWLKTEIVEEYDGLHPDGITKVKSNATKREKEMFEYGYKCGMNDSDKPQGEWKPKNHHTDYCSNCGFEETQWRTADYNFCPSCGARMKGVDDEHTV